MDNPKQGRERPRVELTKRQEREHVVREEGDRGTCPNGTLGRDGTPRTARSMTFRSHQPASPTQKMSPAVALNSPSWAIPGSNPLAASAAITARHGTGPDTIARRRRDR